MRVVTVGIGDFTVYALAEKFESLECGYDTLGIGFLDVKERI